jgi:hypothetical protein
VNECLRCGGFAETWPLSGLRLCAACLETRDVPGWALFLRAPRAVDGWLGSLGILLIPIVLPPIGAALFDLEGIFIGLLAGIVLSVGAFTLRVWSPARLRRWRAVVLEQHGASALVEQSTLVEYHVFAPRRHDVGALVVVDGGVAFFGQRGTRFAVRREDIASASVPLLVGAQVNLTDRERVHLFVLYHGRAGESARALAREIVERLTSSLPPSPT